jgi:hypothetical protein
MKIYIASSWKNQHAVELLTAELRRRNHTVLSFVENNYGEGAGAMKPVPFDEWVWSDKGGASFDFDTGGAMESDLVIYIGPSGTDAWAEVGAAWAKEVPILGLIAKGEQSGLMRRMVVWYETVTGLLQAIEDREAGA